VRKVESSGKDDMGSIVFYGFVGLWSSDELLRWVSIDQKNIFN
ncbi:hypothetical protein THOM_2898, partial [Trachipleistophora hominis]